MTSPATHLFLGTLDDKSIEFPYGPIAAAQIDEMRLVLRHALYTDRVLVVEEGFVLAAREVMAPKDSKQVFLPAIRAGLMQVASRERDFGAHMAQRAASRHATPPPTPALARYLEQVQKACEDRAAFLNYPPSADNLWTFQRLVALCESARLEQLSGIAGQDLRRRMLPAFRQAFETGNSGRQWTARAAWEAAARQCFPGQPLVLHALMCLASRERQILRAASMVRHNHGVSMEVETGFSPQTHDLVDVPVGQGQVDGSESESGALPYPRVRLSDLVAGFEAVLQKLADEHSRLRHAKRSYLDQLHAPRLQTDELAAASDHYEQCLHEVLGTSPLEQWSLTAAAAGAAVNQLTDPVTDLLLRARPPAERALFSATAQVRGDRRRFLRGMVAMGVCIGGAWAGNALTSPVLSLVRQTRLAMDDDLPPPIAAPGREALALQVLSVRAPAADG